MTDPDLVEKKLAFVDTCVRELRELSRPERIEGDIREERFVAHTLQIAIQAALDVASHIVSAERLGEPQTNRELFDLLRRGGWLSAELSDMLGKMAGFRNIVVHGYQMSSTFRNCRNLAGQSCEISSTIAWTICSPLQPQSDPD